MKGQIAQWRGDNVQEVERLLGNHLARAAKAGDKLKVTGIGIDLELSLGDTVTVDEDRLGIIRHQTEKPLKETWVTWQGNNLHKCESFLKQYKVRLKADSNKLKLYGDDTLMPWFILQLGDRLVNRDGLIIISKVGKDHRD